MKSVKKLLVFLLIPGIFVTSSCDQVDNILTETGLTTAEAAEGLKAALDVGTDSSVKILSATDGYYTDLVVKILLPPEAENITKNISKVPGGTQLLERTILSINRAAEDAAKEATPIFKKAITEITFDDAMKILNGVDTAAMVYLKDKTYSALYTAFEPKINTSLAKPIVFNTSAEDAYKTLVNTYNTASLNGVLFPKITNNTLSAYTTNKALAGLFYKIGMEEKKIRTDAKHRVNAALQKAFSK